MDFQDKFSIETKEVYKMYYAREKKTHALTLKAGLLVTALVRK